MQRTQTTKFFCFLLLLGLSRPTMAATFLEIGDFLETADSSLSSPEKYLDQGGTSSSLPLEEVQLKIGSDLEPGDNSIAIRLHPKSATSDKLRKELWHAGLKEKSKDLRQSRRSILLNRYLIVLRYFEIQALKRFNSKGQQIVENQLRAISGIPGQFDPSALAKTTKKRDELSDTGLALLEEQKLLLKIIQQNKSKTVPKKLIRMKQMDKIMDQFKNISKDAMQSLANQYEGKIQALHDKSRIELEILGQADFPKVNYLQLTTKKDRPGQYKNSIELGFSWNLDDFDGQQKRRVLIEEKADREKMTVRFTQHQQAMLELLVRSRVLQKRIKTAGDSGLKGIRNTLKNSGTVSPDKLFALDLLSLESEEGQMLRKFQYVATLLKIMGMVDMDQYKFKSLFREVSS